MEHKRLEPQALDGDALSLHEFAYLIAVALGPVRDLESREWHFDRRHLAPGGRLPMQFYARAVPPPPPLHAGDTVAVSASDVAVPQLAHCRLAPHARAALVFVETSSEPVLPSERTTAPLYPLRVGWF